MELLIAFLLLVAMPGAPSSDALAPSSFLFLYSTKASVQKDCSLGRSALCPPNT